MRRSLLWCLLFLATAARGAGPYPPAPEAGWWALVGAYDEELRALQSQTQPSREIAKATILGSEVVFAEVAGRPVVFIESGISMVNAAMRLQAAFERLPIRGVLFAGIAGGTDPELKKGDVVIPTEWYHHGEAAYFNETPPGSGSYSIPKADWAVYPRGNYGMIHPTPTQLRRLGDSKMQPREMFPADAELLALAIETSKEASGLKRPGGEPAKVVIGGAGVSGMVFMDNRGYREFVFKAWGARCLDMESSALAQVAYVNRKPILIIRALSDLAGGQDGVNEYVETSALAADNAAKFLGLLVQKLPY